MRFRALPSVLALTSLMAFPARAQAPDARGCVESRDLATKLQKTHKLIEARDELLVCSAKSCPAAVRAECTRRMAPMTAAIPAVVFDVKDEAGQALAGAKVTLEGEVVAEHLDGRPVSLDPGDHDLTFEVAGRPPVTLKLTLFEGEQSRHEAVVVPAPAPVAPVETPAPPPPPLPLPPPSSASGQSTQQAIGVQVAAVGAVGLTVGAFLGITALGESAAAGNNPCPSHTGCSQQGTNDRSAASSFGTAAAVGLIAGVLVGGTGLVLVLTAPPGYAPQAGVEIGPGHVGLRGTF